MKIEEFKKGDIITRIEPVVQIKEDHMSMFGGVRETRDNSLIGKPVKFVAIANGLIYYKDSDGKKEGFTQPQSIIHYKFKDGWAEYVDPKTL